MLVFFAEPTVSFIALLRRNFSGVFAAILIGAPVCGLRPSRALRLAKTSLPKPGSANSSLRFTSLAANSASSSKISLT